MQAKATEEKNIYGTTLDNFEDSIPQYLESIGIGGINYVEPVDEYLDRLGSSGYEFFDGMELNPYVRSYSDYDDNGAYDRVREQFRDEVYSICSEFEERYQLMAGVVQTYNEETHKPEYTAQTVPVFRDTETGEYKSIYDVAAEMAERLPAEIEAETVTDSHFSWEYGWEYEEADIAYDVSDIDVDSAMEETYDSMKKLTDVIIHEAERNSAAEKHGQSADIKKSTDKERSRPKSRDDFER